MLLDCGFYDVHAKSVKAGVLKGRGIQKREHKEHVNKGEEREYLVQDHFFPSCY